MDMSYIYCEYWSLKDYLKVFFITYWKDIIFSFKLKYFKKKCFLSHIEKTRFSSYEYRVYILMGFQQYIGKIKLSSSVYIMNFNMD